jgi:hypothetical protein
MDYFAGLDISMDQTHVCVLDREGVVVRESKTASMAQAIADELAKAPSCRRIVFETGRMAPILFHELSRLGLPVVCVESRQAYQALKSLVTHKTDRERGRARDRRRHRRARRPSAIARAVLAGPWPVPLSLAWRRLQLRQPTASRRHAISAE